MNKAVRRLSITCLVMFVVLLAWVNYLQVFRVNSLANEPGNARIQDQALMVDRGEIIVAGGGQQKVVANSRLLKGGLYERHYPDPYAYAPVTGYDSLFSNTGIEQTEDKFLNGTASSLAIYNLKGLFTGHSKQGASVYLTIDPKVQEAAYAALVAMGNSDGGKPAALVAIDPSTGAILALASYPSYNPNKLATLNSAQLIKNDKALLGDPSQPLINRAIDDTFPPGSTFKIVTSSTAFSTGKVTGTTSTISAPQFYTPPDTSHALTNDGDSTCGDGNPQIILAFTLSCNTAFGKLGVSLSPSALHKYATLFGFNSGVSGGNPALTIPLPVTPSLYPQENDPAYRALSAIGQLNDLVTPLQEAMMAATVANHGVLMHPYLVQEIRAPDQEIVQNTQPSELRQVISSSVAADLTQMMISVTHNPAGTAYYTANPSVANGISIAGKTGTAQNGPNNSGLDDAVFTCFAPASSPQIAVGVIVKGGGFGADAAAPIAVKAIEAYLEKH
jgi:peptidoglycan glycosyltransferase